MYLVFAVLAGIVGGALSIGMRMKLQQPGCRSFPIRTPTTCSPRRMASS